MATVLNFLSPSNPSTEILPAASGGFNTIGFYGPGFGLSVKVGEYNETTYRTTEDGQTDGSALPNLRYANTSGAFVASEILGTELQEVNDSEATLRIRLTTDSAIQTQNAKFRTFDKTSIDSAPSGVNVFAAEIIKPSGGLTGTGDVNWTQIEGSGTVLSLDDQAVASTEHNFYLALTSTPTSIGEKTNFAFYFEAEFL
jgi:hypothetical protein